ncbi:MAG: NAD(P)-dependent oxidoreductase [Alphaproteobacteria bacterium]
MLEHRNAIPLKPVRVVIIGAGGFVGGASAAMLEAQNIPTLRIGRDSVDLLTSDAIGKLIALLKPDDALVVVSAIAPCKTVSMLSDNIRMMESVCLALEKAPVAHVAYISSDAVYADDTNPLTEESRIQPDSLHGMMHAARELMLRSVVGDTPFAALRPSLLYGVDDPHNGYGPNQFRRRGQAGEDIVLFGEGEERRDHVLIDDVAAIILNVLLRRSAGALNVATGSVASFRDIAELVAGHFEKPPRIVGRPRSGPMPHDGYRPFDIRACKAAFPDFRYTPLAEGIAVTHDRSKGQEIAGT